MTLPSISQTDTVNDSLICLPKRTLQHVIKDLETGDLATKELALERRINIQLQTTVSVKDSIIGIYQEKETMYDQEIMLLKRTIDTKDEQIQLYQDKMNQYKTERNIAIGTGATIIIGILTALITG